MKRILLPGIDEPHRESLAYLLVRAGWSVSGLLEDLSRKGGAREAFSAIGISLHEVPDEKEYDFVFFEEGDKERYPYAFTDIMARPLITFQALLEENYGSRQFIGVTGTHGKGTVAAMIAWILEVAGEDPEFLIAGRLVNFKDRKSRGEGSYLVVELDESRESHRLLECQYMLCNFLERDHLESFPTMNDQVHEIQRILEQNRYLRECFVNLDCAGNRRLVEGLAMRPTGYALHHRAEFHGEVSTDSGAVQLTIHRRGEPLGGATLGVAGSYNGINALGAYAVTSRLGIEKGLILEALQSFRGLEDRFSILSGAGRRVIKDVTSHPTGINAVLQEELSEAKGRRIVALLVENWQLFEELFQEYRSALSQVDRLLLFDGQQQNGRPNKALRSKMDEVVPEVDLLSEIEPLLRRIEETSREGDSIYFFGDKDFAKLGDRLVASMVTEKSVLDGEEQQPEMDGPLNLGQEDEE